MAAVPGRPDTRDQAARALLASSEFRALVSRRWKVSLSLLGMLLLLYFGFILLATGEAGPLSEKLDNVVTLAIPAALVVIGVGFLLVAAYVGWANDSYDPEVERLRQLLRR